jgi:glucose/arabinose dehydrogenase
MKYFFLLLLPFTVFAAPKFKHDVLVTGKGVIWGFDFLPDGKVLFTEREGRLSVLDPKTNKTTEVAGVPKVYSVGQGGMLDVRVHPKNSFIYITYSEPKNGNLSATVLARFKLKENKVSEFQKLFEATANENPYHYGSRIEFLEGKIFITSGERGDRPAVQKLENTLGKVMRMNEDGSNPEIWTRGHRSPQGLVLRPGTSELWEAEMGPKGGDEINIIKKDANYGWAVVTFGKEYDGPKIGEGTTKKGMEEPVFYWVPSISPSAITFWKNDLWLANLSGRHLRRLELNGQKVVNQEKVLDDLGWRFRNVRPGPDGNLWFSTDEGRIGRLRK